MSLKPRMASPVALVPDLADPLQALGRALFASAEQSGIPKGTLYLVYLRVSQINGDSVCVELHSRNALQAGATPERVTAVAAWRESALFNEAERAALALGEAIARIADRPDPVPDEIYREAERHYEGQALATLIAGIATANFYNRLNVATRQIAGAN
jgi:alkylhydroperoxidase AhpD family core domain